MKQLLQNLKTGATEILDVPLPAAGRGQVLIRTSRTVVSAGTERILVDFGKAGWIEKARQQPEKVRQVLDKIRSDGLLPAVEAVSRKLGEPLPLGYSHAGVVIGMGDGPANSHLKIGDRVASNGPHAEVVCVPGNLCARIPDGVSDDEAAFTVLGAIALQGVRLASPALGERFMVFGLGLVGLLAVQLLRASGCPVLAVDVNERRLKLAEACGAEPVDLGKGSDPVSAATAWSGGRGVDGALIAASAKDDEIVHQAAQACRKRGRIVLVGVVDLNLRRSDFYEKELTFQVSCSYGPGRYDERYEKLGQDYPFGYVRWTEQRNFEAVLEAMRAGQLRVKELITHRMALEEAARSYEKILHDPEALGIILEYGHGQMVQLEGKAAAAPAPPAIDPAPKPDSRSPLNAAADGPRGNDQGVYGNDRGGGVNVGVIGAGNYARTILLPAHKGSRANISTVADVNPVAAADAAGKFGAGKSVTDYRAILQDPEIQAVYILVGHHLHSRFVCEALQAGKHVFVEKPLCLNESQLNEVCSVYSPAPGKPLLMVGFNRRFSPHTTKIKELLQGRKEPLCMTMTVNAGFIPPEHWTQDPERGGGRIIGEGCHFIDLMSYLAGSPVTAVSAMTAEGCRPPSEDKMSMLLNFGDGSVGTVNYFANGSKSYPKEILEVFSEGRVLRMENFRATRGYGFRGFRSFRTWRQDKGHRAEIAAFIEAVASGGAPLIPFNQIVNATRASFAAVESAKTGKVIAVGP